MKVKILDKIINLNINHIQNIIAKNFEKLSKESIDNGIDANNKTFIKPKAGNKPVYKTGELYNKMYSRYNKIYLNEYANILQKGSKYKPRKFMPMKDTKLFEKLMELSKKEILK